MTKLLAALIVSTFAVGAFAADAASAPASAPAKKVKAEKKAEKKAPAASAATSKESSNFFESHRFAGAVREVRTPGLGRAFSLVRAFSP